jgi:hypothetical protein
VSRQDLREIVALAIDAAGLGTYSTVYDGTEPWPIFLRKTPDEPDECIVVECYGLGGDFETGVQVRLRGSREDSTTAEDRADAIRAELHGLGETTRGTTTLVLLTHTSTADLGSDKHGRDQVTVNLRALTDDPNTALDY